MFSPHIPDFLLRSSVPDGGHVGPGLLVNAARLSLPVADASLLLLVDDLVESLVGENGEALVTAGRSEDARRAGQYLTDASGCGAHGMIVR